MKVKDLVEQLQKVNQELEVVIAVTSHNVEAWEVDRIDLGWEPSGVVSIEAGEKILS